MPARVKARRVPPNPVGGRLLSVVTYNPGSAATYSTTSSTASDVDATNLVTTFTAPPSGKVVVRLSGWARTLTGGQRHNWSLRDAGGDVAGTDLGVTESANFTRCSAPIYLTGLTAGTSYTYKWGFRSPDNTSTATIIVGGTAASARGPAVMEVFEVTA